jgi:hypothetical protein
MWSEWDVMKAKKNIDDQRDPRSYVPPQPRKFDKIMMVIVWGLIIAAGIAAGFNK